MKDKLLSAVRDYNMLSPGDNVVVGVSGGADSMCLLSLLSETAPQLGITVFAAHFNHMIRGDEADRDENFVKSFCEGKGITCFCGRADVPGEAQKTGESTEECARRLRYDFLMNVLPGSKIATAHTASDSIETVLMNFARGSGLHGLCGIPPVRGRIIRPLLYFTREDTEKCCAERSVAYITDSTNLCTDYSRNAIRLNVIPQIKSIYPSFSANALRCINIIREEDAYLNHQAEKMLSSCKKEDRLEITLLKDLPPAILRRVVSLFVSGRLSHDVSFKHIDTICKIIADGHGAVELTGRERIVCTDNSLYFDNIRTPVSVYTEISIPESGGKFVFFNKTLDIFFSDNYNPSVTSKNIFAFSVPDTTSLTVRSRKEGDKITLLYRNCTKTLKKLFCEAHIPVEKRNEIPVVADKNGVIFVDGFGTDKARTAKLTDKKYMFIKLGYVNNE